MSNTKKAKKSVFDGVLNGIERIGNKLPHPITLFFILAVFVVALSALLSAMGVSATGDLVSNGKMQETTVTAQSLLTREGIVFMLTKAVDNFTGYAPLGMVLVAMLGVGVAETSGFIAAATKRIVAVTPRSLITPVLVFLGSCPTSPPMWATSFWFPWGPSFSSPMAATPWRVSPPPSQGCPADSLPTCSSEPWTP